MKQISTILLTLVLFLSIQNSATCTTPPEASKKETLELLAILPLTGNGASQGEWVRNGLTLAAEEVNAEINAEVNAEVNKTAKYKISLKFEDSIGGDPKTALGIYNRYFHEDGTKTPLFFSWGSGVGIALSPLSNKDKVIQFGLATSSPKYRSADDYTFRNFPSADIETNFLADAVKNTLKINKTFIISTNNEYGQGLASSFRESYQKVAGEILGEETIEMNQQDFRSQITKLKSKNPELIYLAVYPNEGALFIKQARQLGLKSKLISSLAILGEKDFMNLAGKENVDGLIVSTPSFLSSNSQNPEVQNFIKAYQAKFHEEVTPQHLYAARAYDSLKILSKILNTCHQSADCLKSQLFKVQNYPGSAGSISFDSSGDISAKFIFIQAQGGKFVEL